MSDQPPKLLKFTVISMGFVILGGFLWVGAVVAQRLSEENNTPALSSYDSKKECTEITLPKLPGAKIAFQNKEWILSTRHEIYRYSECGDLRQKVTLERIKEAT